MVCATVGMLDTRFGLGLILAVVNLPLPLKLMVNAVADLRVELEEAARGDDARLPRLSWKIVLPLCRPALIAVFIFSSITAWNDFLFGLIPTTSDAVPMTVGALFFCATSGGSVQCAALGSCACSLASFQADQAISQNRRIRTWTTENWVTAVP